MAKPVWTKEVSDTSYIKFGLVVNPAKAILSFETETKATFGISVIPMSHKLWQANQPTSNTFITLNMKGDTISVV